MLAPRARLPEALVVEFSGVSLGSARITGDLREQRPGASGQPLMFGVPGKPVHTPPPKAKGP